MAWKQINHSRGVAGILCIVLMPVVAFAQTPAPQRAVWPEQNAYSAAPPGNLPEGAQATGYTAPVAAFPATSPALRSSTTPAPSPSAAPAKDVESKPLPLPTHKGDASARGGVASEHAPHVGGLGSLVTMCGSLALVVGLFLLAAWAVRRTRPGGTLALPKDVFEVLGRAPLLGRHQVHLLRCGKRLVLVSVTPSGIDTITEIEDQEEVDRLSGLCRQALPDSASAVFRQVFQQFAHDRTSGGWGRRNASGRVDTAAILQSSQPLATREVSHG